MKHVILPAALLAPVLALAQPQFSNPGFENWQNLGTGTEEPTEWSSIKTSDGGSFINNLAPQVSWRSTDFHSGAYSVQLKSVNTSIGIVANGTLTCGRVHAELNPNNGYVFTDAGNADWNQALTGRPDSIIGWYKATIVGADFPTLKAALHTSTGSIPENGTLGNWVGGADWNGPSTTVGEWTRFAVPVNYFSAGAPEWALVVVTSGNGLESEVGTEVWYDDFALIYNVTPVPSENMAYVTADDGFALNVDFSTGGEPVAATDFVAELSDANGDWTAPVAIGSLNTTLGTGTIPCVIPAGTPSGTGYLIRVTNASPFYAPLEAGITIDLSTSVAANAGTGASVRSLDNGIVVDLSRAAGGPVLCEVFDARGALLARETLMGAGQHRLSLPPAPGVYTVRLTGNGVGGAHRVTLW